MRPTSLFAVLMFLSSSILHATTVRIQFIHNASPETFDLYLGDKLIYDDLPVLNATPYLDLVIAEESVLGVAPSDSRSAEDVFLTTLFQANDQESYVVMLIGSMSGNPPLGFKIYGPAKEITDEPTNVGLLFFHGAIDLPQLDIQTCNSLLYNNVNYGEFAGYLEVPAKAVYVLQFTPSRDNTVKLASYDDNLSFWQGKTAVLFTRSTPNASFSSEFELWAALSNGSTFAIPRHENDIDESGNQRWLMGKEVWVFPNPTTEWLTAGLQLSADADLQTLIVNDRGKVIESKNFGLYPAGYHQLQFHVGSLPKGQYFLTIVRDKQVMKKVPFNIAVH